MNLQRRTFLGFVAATGFFAMLRTDPFQRIDLPYRMTFSGPGYEVQAPAVKRIEETEHGFSFIAEPLNLTEAVNVDRVSLYTADGQLIKTGQFSNMVYAINGDTLKVTQTLTANRKFHTPDEMIQAYLRERHTNR